MHTQALGETTYQSHSISLVCSPFEYCHFSLQILSHPCCPLHWEALLKFHVLSPFSALCFLLNSYNHRRDRILLLHSLTNFLGFTGGSVVKNLPASAWAVGSILGSGRYSGEGNGNPPGILAWKIPWTEEPGGSQRVRHTWASEQTLIDCLS